MAKKMTYEELMYFEHDERNIRNCIECPYYDEYKDMKTTEIAAEVKKRIEATITQYTS